VIVHLGNLDKGWSANKGKKWLILHSGRDLNSLVLDRGRSIHFDRGWDSKVDRGRRQFRLAKEVVRFLPVDRVHYIQQNLSILLPHD